MNIDDVNDNPPEFIDLQETSFSVANDTRANFYVGTVKVNYIKGSDVYFS